MRTVFLLFFLGLGVTVAAISEGRAFWRYQQAQLNNDSERTTEVRPVQVARTNNSRSLNLTNTE